MKLLSPKPITEYTAEEYHTFYRKMLNNSCPEPNTGCILWLRSTIRGYGRTWFNNRHTYVHRWMLEYKLKRPLRNGCNALHKCDTPSCINPDHLWEGTHKENMEDCVNKGRLVIRERKTHCKNGHLFSGKNIFIHKRKDKHATYEHRSCRTCRHLRNKKRDRRNVETIKSKENR